MSNGIKPSNGNILDKERIVLNVGGIMYETYRSTLTRYPDSFLGRMFHERNRDMLHPTNGNEHFIDRNGLAFRFILEYYRTGKILWQENNNNGGVTRRELEEELDFFQIPVELPSELNKFTAEEATEILENFALTMKQVIEEMRRNFRSAVTIIFPMCDFDRFSVYPELSSVVSLVAPFKENGSPILQNFGGHIQKYLIEEYPGLSCSFTFQGNIRDEGVYKWRMELPSLHKDTVKRIIGSSSLNRLIDRSYSG
ncbi:1646_t:CDS:2 [Ambispora leptoticha]|uniref:1646_t:CDS:1 n=1 Tax=Ambispora leptoticha TaxID=144679 RepID=A0A9N9DAB7_9GLOM|nr:1646_t:CDS:2 [Ambispora leptoticha]